MSIGMTAKCLLTCCAVMFCLPFSGRQAGRYQLRVENQAEMPVWIDSASVTPLPTGKFEIRLTAKNVGNVPIALFAIPLPDGLTGFGFPLKPGESCEIVASFPMGGEFKKLAEQGTLDSWTVRVTGLQWAEDAGVPVKLDISVLAEPGPGVEVHFPNEGIRFPQEPGDEESMQVTIGVRSGMKVLSYARVEAEIHNTSNTLLREAWYKLNGFVDGEWEDISEMGLLTNLSAGQTLSKAIRVPIEVLDNGVRKRFEKFQFVVTKAKYDQSEANKKP